MRYLALTLLFTLPVQDRQEPSWGPSWEHWRDYLVPPRAEQTWLDVAWRPVFWDAVVEAQEARKPVLLWAMNGHPLGCT